MEDRLLGALLDASLSLSSLSRPSSTLDVFEEYVDRSMLATLETRDANGDVMGARPGGAELVGFAGRDLARP